MAMGNLLESGSIMSERHNQSKYIAVQIDFHSLQIAGFRTAGSIKRSVFAFYKSSSTCSYASRAKSAFGL